MLERITEDAELIKSLRCESVINDEHPRCESCKYGVVVCHGSREDVYGCDSRRIENDAADAIEECISRLPKWISVDECLPKYGERVIVTDGEFVGEAFLTYKNEWIITSLSIERYFEISIIAWMQLPKPPKGE